MTSTTNSIVTSNADGQFVDASSNFANKANIYQTVY